MDPQAALKSLDTALRDKDKDGVFEYSDALIGWLEKGGFMPQFDMADWRRMLSRQEFLGVLKCLRDVTAMK